jgi:hypothetical protein
MEWVFNAVLRSHYPRERDAVPIVREAGWTPGPIWTGTENDAANGIHSLDLPARSETLFRLCLYNPDSLFTCVLKKV